VLSSNGGQDFASLLRGMGELGYGFAYRVLDAQYFGVAQRRRRVFVVGCLGDWRSAAAVLFESHSLSGNPAPSREKREVTPTLTKECTGVSRTGHNEDGWYIPTISKCITKGIAQRYDSETETMIPIPLDLRNAGRDPEKYDEINRQGVGVGEAGDPAHTLTSACVHGVAQPTFALDEYNQSGHKEVCYPLRTASGDGIPKVNVAHPIAFTTEQTPKFNKNQALTLTKSEAKHNQSVLTGMAVRRLTPVECERLQGFPDKYTNIPWRNKLESPDGPRYKALGNSMAVPVMKWIGSRIQQVEGI
jgi:DNA (cytosine-5)-methyltransferase 1